MVGFIRILIEQCLGCAICADVCPTKALVQGREAPIPDYYFDLCDNCQECVKQCPFNAIEVIKKQVVQI